MGYLTSTRASIKQEDELIELQGEIEYEPLDIGFISVMILGTIYFSVLEVIQSMTLKSQYLKLWNLVDIAYLAINICLIVDIFKRYMAEDTFTILAIAQVALIGTVFINWLRVFETTVIYIRLIK